MKISMKLNAVVLAVMAGFVVSIGFLVWSTTEAQQVGSLSNRTHIAIRETNTAIRSTQALLMTSDSLEEAYQDYRSQIDRAGDAMETLAHHPAWSGLSEDLHERAHGSLDVWDLVLEDLEPVNAGIEQIIDTDIPGIRSKSGILRLNSQVREQDEYDGRLSVDLRNIDRRIQQAIASGTDFIVGSLGTLVEQVEQEAAAQVRRSLAISLAVSAAALVVGLGFLLLFGKRLSGRISRLNAVTTQLAARNFAISAGDNSKDELGALGSDLDRLIESVSGFFSAVQRAVTAADELQHELNASHEQSASALNQITTNIENIQQRFSSLNSNITSSARHIGTIESNIANFSERTQKQTDSMSSVSSSIEEITANVNSVTRLSLDRKRAAEEVSETVRDGSEKVSGTNEIIRSISQEIDDILEIIEIINSVSEQTHLLSMNAAIESAHAGDAGKGFAVVAEEIRKLAESTSENAARIDRNLRDITEKIREALQSSEISAQSFEEIQREVSDFSNALDEIHHSMQELSAGSNEVLSSVSSVTETTEKTNQDAQGMSASVAEIRQAMDNVTEVSSELSGGVDEIQRGSREILDSMVAGNETANDSRRRMQEVQQLLDTFRVSESFIESLEPAEEKEAS
ncbi:MAG: methyl-accepting chemotaxis protein, partial [Spirochaetota bacterium]